MWAWIRRLLYGAAVEPEQPATHAESVREWPKTEPAPAPSLPDIRKRIAFVDVETTGLYSADRIVSIGIIIAGWDWIFRRTDIVEWRYLIFDPGKKSHPRAEAVHGYSDWTLRHQQPFGDHAREIRKLLDSADLIAAHNAEFDIGFIQGELERSGLPILAKPLYCTMLEYRDQFPGRKSALDVACSHYGLRRSGATHGALEDAWMALGLYLGLNYIDADLRRIACDGPTNFIPCPPEPASIPPRRRKRTARSRSDSFGAEA